MNEYDSYPNGRLAASISAFEMITHCSQFHKAKVGRFFVETEREDQDKLRDVIRKVRNAVAWAAENVGGARMIRAGDERGSCDCCSG